MQSGGGISADDGASVSLRGASSISSNKATVRAVLGGWWQVKVTYTDEGAVLGWWRQAQVTYTDVCGTGERRRGRHGWEQ